MTRTILPAIALAALSGAASAQTVSLSGEARMGVQAMHGLVWSWAQDATLQLDFTVEIEADHGLSFGAWTAAEISNAPGIFSGSRIWVGAGDLLLTFGNANGALTEFGYLGGGGVGYEGGILNGDAAGLDAVAQEEDTAGPGPEIVRLDDALGETALSVSHQRGGSTEFGVQRSLGAWTLAAGYSDAMGFDNWALSGTYEAQGWGAGLLVAEVLGSTNWALSGTADLGGGALYAYVGEVFGLDAYGLSYAHDLGGDAVLTAGAERVGAVTVVSLGVAFAF
ncbi:hypothetical protein [Pararhodobacter sp.]